MMTRKIFRVRIQSLLRRTYLLAPVERLRYHIKAFELRKRNKRFIQENPDFALPPAYLAFDAYSSSHWEFYKLSGEITVKFLANLTKKYFPAGNRLAAIYEWGCGPARITRQLRSVYGNRIEIHASDYNPQTIEWCQQHIIGVQFIQNNLQPPLPYPDNKFDFVYAISVFTHLSETNGLAWAAELYRVLRPGGILLITTDSDRVYQNEMLPAEKKKYDTAGFVVKDKYEEGKKMYLARHSPKYIKEKLLNQFDILEHVPGDFPFMKQDYWVARKK